MLARQPRIDRANCPLTAWRRDELNAVTLRACPTLPSSSRPAIVAYDEQAHGYSSRKSSRRSFGAFTAVMPTTPRVMQPPSTTAGTKPISRAMVPS